MERTVSKLFVLAFALVVTGARAANLTILGGGAVTGSSSAPRAVIPPPTFDSKLTLGGGLSLIATAGTLLNFEIGVLYVPRKYGTVPGADVTLHMLEFPLMVRFTFIPILTVGVGGFWAVRVGDGGGAVLPVASLNRNDFGLVGAVGAEFPVGPSALLVEVRYAFGLSDMDPDPIGTLHSRTWQFLAGVRFGL